MPVLSWIPEGIKDELGWSVEDAAQQELNQGTRKGFDPNRGKDGDINRGFIEKGLDWALGNDTDAIRTRARELQIERLQDSTAGQLIQDNRPGYEFGSGTSQKEINRVGREIERRAPYVTQIMATGELKDKYTRQDLQSMDVDTLGGILKKAQQAETLTDYAQNPVVQNQLRQQQFTNQMMIGQMAQADRRAADQMEIARMNNQLQMRREDRADARNDRKDRQAMIMMLMKGLAQMGQGIAI